MKTTGLGERWHVRYNHHQGLHVHDENGLIVAYVGSRERHADAHLIAAAPELLEAAQAVIAVRDAEREGEASTEELLDAIAGLDGAIAEATVRVSA